MFESKTQNKKSQHKNSAGVVSGDAVGDGAVDGDAVTTVVDAASGTVAGTGIEVGIVAAATTR